MLVCHLRRKMGGVRDGVSAESRVTLTQSFDKYLNPNYLKTIVFDVEKVWEVAWVVAEGVYSFNRLPEF